MVSQRKNINVHSPVAYGVNQTMLVCNTTTPQTMLLSLQWFWLTDASKWVLKNISQQRRNTLHNAFISCLLPIFQVFFGSGKELYFHKSSSLITRPRLFLMSSCPCLIISAMAGEDIRYSVSSIACFLAVSLFRDFRAFFIRPSSSAMMLNSRNSSAFSCSDVILQKLLFTAAKLRINTETNKLL